MKILSINIRGLGAEPKKPALKRLITTMIPTVLLLQETMTEGKKAEEIVRECIKYWGMTSSDADGNSGGTLTAWSLALKMISIKKFDATIRVELEDSEIGKQFTILNVYGRFYDRKFFWEKLKDSEALDVQNLILWGDLNLTFSSNKVWGKNAITDSLGPYFRSMGTFQTRNKSLSEETIYGKFGESEEYFQKME